MAEAASNSLSPRPAKRIKSDDGNTCNEIDSTTDKVVYEQPSHSVTSCSDINDEEPTSLKEEPPMFYSFEDFDIIRVLSNSEDNKSVAVEGRLLGREGTAVAMLQKLPFNNEKLVDIFSSKTSMVRLFHNDIYYNHMAMIPAELNEIKASIIYPAEEKHILRFLKESSSMINETPYLYKQVTKKFISSSSYSQQWIYNILEHKKEADRIVFEDLDPDVGFILIPDMKWTGEQMEDLYLQALVVRRDIGCIRDLTDKHIPLLKNIYEKGSIAIKEKYGVPANKLRVYLHYQPSFYHLHVHFSSLLFQAPGTWSGKAHLIPNVISNLEIASDYYQKATLPFTVKDNHPLKEKFQEQGYFS